jgi:hypothetical protein
MAKKIIIEFNDVPVIGYAFSYTITIAGIDITYNSGATTVFGEYSVIPINTGSEIALQLSLTEDIDNTLKFLTDNFVNNSVDYARVGNTIEIDVSADAVITIDSGFTNPSLEISVIDVPVVSQNIKYFIVYEDYLLNIYLKGYLGFKTEIFGEIQIKKGSVQSILEPIRGTGLNLSLESSASLSFDEFGLAEEGDYVVKLTKSGQTVFNGFIKPDGIQQSYVADLWFVNIECVDGLGTLKDLSFVKSNGLQFTGKTSIYDIIKGCVDRTGLTMTINSSIDVHYLDYTGENILKDTYLNPSRYFKKDNDTIMDCDAVLTSVLNLFSAVITQQDGQWWILRPNDLKLGKANSFVNNNDDSIFNKNFNTILGSQINGFYPHHCGGSQQIETKGAVSAYRLNYEYGFLEGVFDNADLVHDNLLNYEGWTKFIPQSPFFNNILVNDPLDSQGVLMNSLPVSPSVNNKVNVLTSDSVNVTQGTVLKFTSRMSSNSYMQVFSFKIITSDGYYYNLNNFGETKWYKKSEYPELFDPFLAITLGNINNPSGSSGNLDVTLEPIKNDCTVQVIICATTRVLSGEPSLTEVSYVNISDITTQTEGKVGEFHTVSRKYPPSSITKENQTVFNGDSDKALIGTLYKSDKETPTALWTRTNKNEQKPLLRISAEDDLRIQRNAIKVFSGDIYGQIPYLSIVSIDGIQGLFMFTEYSYSLKTKQISAKLIQFYSDELGDIQYLFSYDYGNNTIKPTII